MSVAFARKSVVDRPARVPVQARADERWSVSRGPQRAPAVMMAVAGASLGLHALVVATLFVSGRAPPPPTPHEIAVEIVQDAPKQVPKPEPPAAKPRAVKPPVVAKAEPPAPKAEPPKSAPPEPAPAKSAPPPAAETKQVEDLQKELAALKAEHEALASSARAAPAGRGTLADSFQAVALPTTSDGTGETTSYQEIVFSQLAKAKDIGRKPGKPGTSGVRFEIDEAGRLVGADIITPSGIAALDAEALDIVHKAAPFPPPPKGAQREFVANVNFVPQDAP